ncbi:DUF488 domain-containing protein [Marinifilum fragile]|uniref:DUF488 domain-containing protein n=1 Tax=Marinifilum fragile TaxID=570161 RepID=UPI002AAA9625|nr:DUF488 domain-containing protein [Marinifilum fragile]
MIYRKKILLALTEIFEGNLNATDFQKLLFLFTEKQDSRNFDFIPYKFGCFSFQAMADKTALIRDGYLSNSKNWETKYENESFLLSLKDNDRKTLQRIKKSFKDYTTNELIHHIYTNFPYFAINSEIANDILSEEEYLIVEKFKPINESESLFTIGYEGRSIERYLNILIQQNIKILCDVRKNPMSRKYGFAKKTLQNACESVQIKYIHLPELGIQGEKRQTLNTQSDYDKLFADYEKNILPAESKALNLIHSLVKNYGRVALTCYEESPNQCHRTRVANAINQIEETIPLKHL